MIFKMELEFIKGVFVSSTLILCYKIYSDLKYQKRISDQKIEEFERRIDNLEDFRLRFYQLYIGRYRRIGDEEESESEYTDEEEY